jgi:AraC family transcriptional regulator of adaptative response/methylated-DNA-[protein]-cysteine methyltransferase
LSLAIAKESVSAEVTALPDMPRKVYWGVHDSPMGPLLMGVTEEGLCRLEFASGYGLGYDLSLWAKDWPETEFIADSKASAPLASQFRELNPSRWGAGMVALYGSEFQMKVWKALLQIPAGEVMSYDKVAELVGKPKGSRDISKAVNANPISMLIPCHRVLEADGSSAYRWGNERQKLLLAVEAAKARH